MAVTCVAGMGHLGMSPRAENLHEQPMATNPRWKGSVMLMARKESRYYYTPGIHHLLHTVHLLPILNTKTLGFNAPHS
jgi:hypothetical protein